MIRTLEFEPAPARVRRRPRVEGKFLFVGEEKLFVRGVTYGPFGPEGREFESLAQVERDFEAMRTHGINAVRTYTAPPRWLLDAAARHGLRVMVGLAWEQHIAFLEDSELALRILARVESDVRRIQGHPAILCYAIGNEVPAAIVRWHGPGKVESFLERLYRVVKSVDPDGLVTYVNFPTTEYLTDLPFLDFLSFNVYLEREEDFRAYVSRLQNLAGDRPLLMAELGLDAAAHGEEVQARTLDWQVRAAFEGGCAGAMVFAWTDQWFRGGEEIREWSFGVTHRDRRPKPALHAVYRAFRNVPFARKDAQPFVSVVVCSYNGARTIRETLEYLSRMRYPEYEVIVVDDGSADDTSLIASEFEVRLIRTPNRGLSRARNTGLAAARGEIVAYIDDDALPDPHWLTFLTATFQESRHVGVGGPNVPPTDDGFVARCVARSPGGPVHVLLSDTEAEHLPGCNMAFRTEALRAIGGFDARFCVAGDDVDICWRLQERGWTLGFNPAAVVWHRRRDSVGAYWRQQRGYGRAEAMLERKWPEKYNAAGHVSWNGRLYNGLSWGPFLSTRRRIYQGTWGSAPFQWAEESAPKTLGIFAAMPESWGVVALLALAGGLGAFWPPLLWALPVALALVLALLGRTILNARNACRGEVRADRSARLRCLGLTTWLHLIQPIARLCGRVSAGLAPWRRYVPNSAERVYGRTVSLWKEDWLAPERWLQWLEDGLRREGILVRRGGDYDGWDLEIRSGALGFVRITMAIEEHGRGRQLGRFRFQPRWGPFALLGMGVGGVLGLGALVGGAWLVALVLSGIALLLAIRSHQEHAAAIWQADQYVRGLGTSPAAPGLDARPAPPNPRRSPMVPRERVGRSRALAGPVPARTGTDP